MELISMTDFVLQQHKESETNGQYIRRTFKYARLLKQPLTFGMFVPCVNNEPFNYSKHGNKEQFKQAKERVLFKGFKSACSYRVYLEKPESNIDSIETDEYGLFFYNASMQKQRINTIEDLISFNNLELTESAIKQIQ